jgi:hypothetical protein
VTETRRPLLWSALVAAALVLLGVGGVVVLNNTLFSASGFVSQYLSALEHHDAASALSMPGIGDGLPADTQTVLLRGQAIGNLRDTEVISVVDVPAAPTPGTVRVTANFVAGTTTGTSSFDLAPTAPQWGVFSGWRFVQPPIATMRVEVAHDSVFQVGLVPPIDLRTTNPGTSTAFGGTGSFAVFAPGSYAVGKKSALFEAGPVEAAVAQTGDTVNVTVDVQPTALLVGSIQAKVNDFLDSCATQRVLQPTGCPFGYETGNRVQGEPTWSVANYPRVNLVASGDGWTVADSVGTMRITGTLVSLFDGTASPLDESVPVTVNLSVSIGADGTITLAPR